MTLDDRLLLIYRRRKGSDTWHFSGLCSKWPTQGYEFFGGSKTRPRGGELCNECKAKTRTARAEVTKRMLKAGR